MTDGEELKVSDPAWDNSSGTVRLRVGRCRDCGYVFFPAQDHGCESCGAPPSSLRAMSTPAAGVVTASVIVHTHPVYPTPFVVGDIALDGEPVVVQAILRDPRRVGDRVAGTIDKTGQTLVFDATAGAQR